MVIGRAVRKLALVVELAGCTPQDEVVKSGELNAGDAVA
jgi:hypothetical protein